MPDEVDEGIEEGWLEPIRRWMPKLISSALQNEEINSVPYNYLERESYQGFAP